MKLVMAVLFSLVATQIADETRTVFLEDLDGAPIQIALLDMSAQALVSRALSI